MGESPMPRCSILEFHMHRAARHIQITPERKMLMETLAGHMALLRESHPKKASSVVAKRARQCVMMCLRGEALDLQQRRRAA
jgi:hypothetical protein